MILLFSLLIFCLSLPLTQIPYTEILDIGEWKGEMKNGEALVSTWSVKLKMIAIITRNLCKTTEAPWDLF